MHTYGRRMDTQFGFFWSNHSHNEEIAAREALNVTSGHGHTHASVPCLPPPEPFYDLAGFVTVGTLAAIAVCIALSAVCYLQCQMMCKGDAISYVIPSFGRFRGVAAPHPLPHTEMAISPPHRGASGSRLCNGAV